jgi:iron complex outermembrane receptor protein
MWAWTQSPASLSARYGSLRGASSFGASYPKVYVDGIEVANPLLVTQLTPESIERIEVIRGPQGAALYGADAISGVVNIVTRHDGVHDGAPPLEIRSRAGIAASDYADRATPTQAHALTWHAGSGARTATGGASATAIGAFVPGASSRALAANVGGRLAGPRATLTGTARLYAARAGVASSLFGDSARAPGTDGPDYLRPPPGDDAQRLTAYTLGTRATLVAGDRWTHAAVLGVDGYRLSGLADVGSLVPFAADTSAQAASGGGDRATLRLSSIAQLVARQDATAALTISAEQSTLRQRYAPGRAEYAAMRGEYAGAAWAGRMPDESGVPTPSGRGPSRRPAPETMVEWRSSTGLTTQLDASLGGRLYATGGVRLERDAALREFGASSVVALPMLGLAAVRTVGPLSAKLRGAFGEGIRSPRAATRETLIAGATGELSTTLRPERQRGTELGVEIVAGRALTLEATRFDQIASGLLQRVALSPDSDAFGRPMRRIDYALENVGRIANRGWELQADYAAGPVLLSGTLSLVSSRVLRLADDFTGDLRVGDRVLEVPARTSAIAATWTASRWTASATLARAADWINYDRLGLAAAYANPATLPGQLSGATLRTYWRHYGGATRVRASLGRTLRSGFAATLAGENLLGQQRNEPDNATVLPGRSVTLGLRATF